MGGNFLDPLCSPWMQITWLGWFTASRLDSAVGQLLTGQIWSLPHPHPSKVLGIPLSSPMCAHRHTHTCPWSYCSAPLPNAETFGCREGHSCAPSPFGSSVAQTGEEQLQQKLCKHTEKYCVGTASFWCTTWRRREMQSLIPWSLCVTYKPTALIIPDDLTSRYWVMFAKKCLSGRSHRGVVVSPAPIQPWNGKRRDAVFESVTLHSMWSLKYAKQKLDSLIKK